MQTGLTTFQNFYEQIRGKGPLEKAPLAQTVKINSNEDEKPDIFERKENINKKITAAFAIFGALAPVVAINASKGRISGLKNAFKGGFPLKEKLGAVSKVFEIEGFKEIFASSLGGILGGTIGGVLTDKNPENKEAKYKEGIFEFLNNMTPTCLVALGEHKLQNSKKAGSAPIRAAIIASSVAGGMFIANKSSNKINNTIFENNEEKRKFKISDCFVHLDDILSLLVIAKIPFAKAIQADKILPLLYARSGYEAGIAQKWENKK